jgi:protease-4
MKQFFKIVFGSAIGLFLALGVFMVLGFFFMVSVISSMGSSSETTSLKKDEKVMSLSINGAIKDIASDNSFISLVSNAKVLSLRDIQDAIAEAKSNDIIKGIYLDASSVSAGTANIDVIRRSLEDFKSSGKFVVAYGDDYTQGCYYLASVADKVFMNPQGILQLSGLVSKTTFYKGILEKMGIEMQVFKVGTFKGAVEPFMLDKLSDANRKQIVSYQQGIWKNIVGNIASSRNISEEQVNGFADSGDFLAAAEKAVEYGLVDELKYKDDVESYVKELAGIEKDKKLKMVQISTLKKLYQKNTGKKDNQIAVVYAEGEITSSDLLPEYSDENYITEQLADKLIKLNKNDEIKAIVLRVNSPGGSGFVSEQIWKQVNEIKSNKKIVVSMGSVAASGGYYIACAADKIICEPNTLTGSIGVFGIFPNATGLYKKLDVTTDIVKTNNFSDFGDFSRPMKEEEKILMQGAIDRFYDLFITRCADGRQMSKTQIDSIGQGRVWTGEQALACGLVDELGDLDRAVEVAASLAGVEDYSITYVSSIEDPLTKLLKKHIGDIKYSIVNDVLGDEEAEIVNTVKMIKQTRGIQARLPYDLKIF